MLPIFAQMRNRLRLSSAKADGQIQIDPLPAHSDGLTFKNDNFSMVMRHKIENSIVRIECDLEVLTDFTLDYAHTVAFHQIRGIADAIAFSRGFGLMLILDACALPGEPSRPLQSKSPQLATLCTLSEQEIINLVDRERRIARPLNDLTETLMFPQESYVNCGRALDGISRLISSSDDPKKRWKELREKLNLNESYTRLISTYQPFRDTAGLDLSI
jgi:hypothetical protein